MNKYYKVPYWVHELDIDKASQHILIVLHKFKDNVKNTCFPSIETLSKASKMDRRLVMKSIKTLKNKGIISTKKHKGNSNLYLIESYKSDTFESNINDTFESSESVTIKKTESINNVTFESSINDTFESINNVPLTKTNITKTNITNKNTGSIDPAPIKKVEQKTKPKPTKKPTPKPEQKKGEDLPTPNKIFNDPSHTDLYKKNFVGLYIDTFKHFIGTHPAKLNPVETKQAKNIYELCLKTDDVNPMGLYYAYLHSAFKSYLNLNEYSVWPFCDGSLPTPSLIRKHYDKLSRDAKTRHDYSNYREPKWPNDVFIHWHNMITHKLNIAYNMDVDLAKKEALPLTLEFLDMTETEKWDRSYPYRYIERPLEDSVTNYTPPEGYTRVTHSAK